MFFDLAGAGDADSSRAPGLTSGLQGSVNVHRGALLLVPQWQCTSSFVFYIELKSCIPPILTRFALSIIEAMLFEAPDVLCTGKNCVFWG